MTSVSCRHWGISGNLQSTPFIGLSTWKWDIPCYFNAKMVDKGAKIVTSSTLFEGYYGNLLQIGNTKEAGNPTNNIMCQHCQNFLICVIFDSETALQRLRVGMNQERH